MHVLVRSTNMQSLKRFTGFDYKMYKYPSLPLSTYTSLHFFCLQILYIGLELNANLCKHLKTGQTSELPILELAYRCVSALKSANLFQCRWFKA